MIPAAELHAAVGLRVVVSRSYGQLGSLMSALACTSKASDVLTSGVPRNFVRGGLTNSVEDRGQRERGSGGGSPPSQGFWRQL